VAQLERGRGSCVISENAYQVGGDTESRLSDVFHSLVTLYHGPGLVTEDRICIEEEHRAAVPHFLQGGGEMGALIRAVRWADTPLGPIESWSPAFRTMVGMLLGNRFPMLLMWGPNFVQLYNDAYRPILGDKHPRSLGQPCPECWAEIWPIIGPMIQAPFRGEPATWDDDLVLAINRRGFLEECHFKCAYNPVPDETVRPTGIGGVFAPAEETTEKVYVERQLRVLRELAMQTAHEKNVENACRAAASTLSTATRDVPFALFYLIDDPGQPAHLVGAYGFERAEELSASDWPAPGNGLVVIEDLERFRDHLPVSEWNARPTRAVVIPLASPDQTQAYGFVVAGTSPHRAFDEGYRGFFELAGAQVVTAIRNARAFEVERQRGEALALLNQAKTAFFSNVSHEFRTPLTLMLGPIEEGLEDLEQPLPARQRRRQEVVHRSALRLLKLVNSLLDFSRIEAGRAQARYQPTELGGFTADLASSFRSLVEQAGLTLSVDCRTLSEPVYVDREMYEKIVLNLLSNAFKFTFEGGIRVSLEADAQRVRLVVADTGTGIPDSELPHLFERFHRVQGARGRSYEGSGIGLALVQELVGLHRGTVTATSHLARGSVFTVSLPLGSAHLPPECLVTGTTPASTPLGLIPFIQEASQWVSAPTHASDPPPSDAPALPSASRILLADDNADMREYVRHLLVAQGWSVDMVGDGEAALRSIEASLPDLVLTDVMMPKLDGFGVLRALRKKEETRVLPVILLSARAGEEARVEGFNAGADDYLVKPFAARELVARVRAHMNAAVTRKEAKRASDVARATAEKERARLQELLAQVPAIVNFLRGPGLIWEFVHPAAKRVLGTDGLRGKSLREAEREYARPNLVEMLEQVYRTGQRCAGEEVLIKTRDPISNTVVERFWSFTYQAIRDAAGVVEGVMTFDIEVTDQVRARKTSDALTEELKLADRRKDEFLAMLAHELRNPMAAISTALSMLERAAGDPAAMARHREMTRRQMGNLVRLVDDLLDVSRITRGQVELKKHPMDLAVLVQNALNSTRSMVDARGHKLAVTIASGDYRMVGDATRLEQAVVNLLINATKYTEAGGIIAVTLTRDSFHGAAHAVLCVRDSGRGIPVEMLDKVFDLFVQVSPSLDRSSGGLGLGLTLVKRLVEMHGGRVIARSEGVGKGSEFLVRVPLPTSDQPPAEATSRQGSEPPAPSPKRRVVIVEDAEDFRDILQEMLEDNGHEACVAKNGLEGLARILELRPDVALVDLGLPGIDGYELARRVRRAPNGADFYLIALTGYGGAEDRARAEDAGFDGHLVKPPGVEELLQLVSRPKPHRVS
jgi:signal transduction histidine kinase/DNA-binding response OmpR family regulator